MIALKESEVADLKARLEAVPPDEAPSATYVQIDLIYNLANMEEPLPAATGDGQMKGKHYA